MDVTQIVQKFQRWESSSGSSQGRFNLV